MRVLVSGHGADRASLDAARRAVPYKRLVLLTPDPEAPDLDALRWHEALAGVLLEAHRVDPSDLLAILRVAGRAIATHGRHGVRVHLGGGPNLVSSALLLAAFQEGAPAFYCRPEGIVHLPVIQAAALLHRFTPAERAVLCALPPGHAVPLGVLVPPGLALPEVKTALLRLRKAGLVEATHERARLTEAGSYYRDHCLLERRAPPADRAAEPGRPPEAPGEIGRRSV